MLNIQNRESVAYSLKGEFRKRFRSTPLVFRAPGRVNLIGEHTDYNDGYVMPSAIDFYTWVAIARRSDREINVYSGHFHEQVAFSLDRLTPHPAKHWSNFVRGVASELEAAGHPLVGADIVIESNVPIGAGLSSSAALEVSLAVALASIAEVEVNPIELVKLSQRAEHKFGGTRCGIMDQFIATFGHAGHALQLDCRSLEYTPLPIPNDVNILICNSMVKHELAIGEYNRRRSECETAVKLFQTHRPRIKALRDVNLQDLRAHQLSETLYRRSHHVVTENQRVLDAARALRAEDASEFGRLMYESHKSLRDDFEVSCKEVDYLVEIASKCDGVYGARMTGGGFGGCTVNLVDADAVEGVRRKVSEDYTRQTGIAPDIYICKPADGARQVDE